MRATRRTRPSPGAIDVLHSAVVARMSSVLLVLLHGWWLAGCAAALPSSSRRPGTTTPSLEMGGNPQCDCRGPGWKYDNGLDGPCGCGAPGTPGCCPPSGQCKILQPVCNSSAGACCYFRDGSGSCDNIQHLEECVAYTRSVCSRAPPIDGGPAHNATWCPGVTPAQIKCEDAWRDPIGVVQWKADGRCHNTPKGFPGIEL
eukprot:COSAG05_NODE_2667_length_2783_cov_7.122951_5_plen_201_part_00